MEEPYLPFSALALSSKLRDAWVFRWVIDFVHEDFREDFREDFLRCF